MKNVTKGLVGEGRDFERIRRITGYLTGTLDGWNSAKRADTLSLHDALPICQAPGQHAQEGVIKNGQRPAH